MSKKRRRRHPRRGQINAAAWDFILIAIILAGTGFLLGLGVALFYLTGGLLK